MVLRENIKDLAAQCLVDDSQYIVDILVSSGKAPNKVMVIIDGDQGVSIDDCAEVSRKLSKALDDGGWMTDRSYMLEVSTPGLDQPLKLQRQYRKNIGRKIRVKMTDTTLEGLLESVQDESIELSVTTGKGKKKERQAMLIPFDAIEKAFVLISFK